MATSVIFHLTPLQAWEHAQDAGFYEAPSLQEEGFIHCSTEEQVEQVLQRHFKTHENLVKLIIDPSRLTSKLQYDYNEKLNQSFPHIYGPLNIEAVTQIVFLDPITSED